jgi:hypothetical protein
VSDWCLTPKFVSYVIVAFEEMLTSILPLFLQCLPLDIGIVYYLFHCSLFSVNVPDVPTKPLYNHLTQTCTHTNSIILPIRRNY